MLRSCSDKPNHPFAIEVAEVWICLRETEITKICAFQHELQVSRGCYCISGGQRAHVGRLWGVPWRCGTTITVVAQERHGKKAITDRGAGDPSPATPALALGSRAAIGRVRRENVVATAHRGVNTHAVDAAEKT